jgi:hypothetical protein
VPPRPPDREADHDGQRGEDQPVGEGQAGH